MNYTWQKRDSVQEYLTNRLKEMNPEILTPQEHRPRRQQKPSIISMKDGRRIILFPNGDTQTLLTDGTSLHTRKSDRGIWVKKPCGEVDYIPPDPLLQEFAQEKVKAEWERDRALARHDIRRKRTGTNAIEIHDKIMRGVIS